MLGNVFRYNGKTQLAIKHFETTLELLKKYDDHEIVPDSDGMTAGSIKELTQQIINRL
jgi:chemotaxis protein methyltransferase CheR